MALEDLPDLVIERIRTECTFFGSRVGGAAMAERAAEQTEFTVPYAFYEEAGMTEGEPMISPFTQEMLVEFNIIITVENTDRRGQDGARRFATAAGAVINALAGWAPDTIFSPLMSSGMDGEPGVNGARYQWAVKFRTSIMHTDL